MQSNDSLIIPANLAQAIANYLVTRPWGEVNALLAELSKLQPPPPNEAKE